jgi:hypothetical protein
MTLEETLTGWTGPSSTTEQDKQDRTERMVREAVTSHTPFQGCNLAVCTKGSYPNNTNVRTDSDVDIAVQCHDAMYWDEAASGLHPATTSYTGIWTPAKLRSELEVALEAKFPGHVDMSGSTAIRVNSSSARVDADVVPCFDYRYYLSASSSRDGHKVFRKFSGSLINYPAQHLANGRLKNTDTNSNYKKGVRILKRTENAMFSAGVHRVVPSYFVECLAYNCPDSTFMKSTWTDVIREAIVHIWQNLEGVEPTDSSLRWLEVNRSKWLFSSEQPWNRQDGRDFARAAWNYLGYKS